MQDRSTYGGRDFSTTLETTTQQVEQPSAAVNRLHIPVPYFPLRLRASAVQTVLFVIPSTAERLNRGSGQKYGGSDFSATLEMITKLNELLHKKKALNERLSLLFLLNLTSSTSGDVVYSQDR